jgi:hypothetical protein
MPVAWGVLPAHTQHAWRRAWRRLRPALPRHGQVSVLADRGVYAPWRLRRLVQRGWHPFWRSPTGGTLRPARARRFPPFQRVGPQPGTRGRGRGTALQKAGRHLACPLLALGAEG